MSHTIYFQRMNSTIDGFLTIQEDATGKPVFRRLKTRSGQADYEDTDWVNGKSPIPRGNWWLHTDHLPLQAEPYGTPFFPISSDVPMSSDPMHWRNTIWSKNKKYSRNYIGLHCENRWRGSLGCPVIVKSNEFDDVADWLMQQNKNGIFTIKFRVLWKGDD